MLVAGAASRDVDSADPRGWRLGGTVSYATLAIARLGLPVRALIGVDIEAEAAHELDWMRAAGAELELIRLRRAPVLVNLETGHGRVQHCLSPADRLPLAGLPPDWRSPAAAILGPIAGELGPEWAGAFPPATVVALAWHGLFRRIAAGRRVVAEPLRRRRLLARADIAIVSRDDAAAGGAPLTDLLRTGQELVVTGGARGALHVVRTSTGIRPRRLPALPAQAIDPTGAGDVFLAAWTAVRLSSPDSESRALAFATAAASLAVEGVGLTGVPDLARVRGRLEEISV